MSKTQSIGLGIIVICILIFAYTFTFPASPLGNRYYGPAFFPRVLSALIALLALGLVFQRDRSNPEADEELKRGAPDQQNSALPLVARILAVTLGYLLLMHSLGYLASTILYTFSSVWILRPKAHLHWAWLASGSLMFSYLLYYFFAQVMNVMLPLGILG